MRPVCGACRGTGERKLAHQNGLRTRSRDLLSLLHLIRRVDGYGYSLTKIALQKGAAGMGQAEPAALSLLGLKAEVFRAIG